MANQKKTFMSVLLNGLIWENPTFVLMLGMFLVIVIMLVFVVRAWVWRLRLC